VVVGRLEGSATIRVGGERSVEALPQAARSITDDMAKIIEQIQRRKTGSLTLIKAEVACLRRCTGNGVGGILQYIERTQDQWEIGQWEGMN
jgi:hypothetical protein